MTPSLPDEGHGDRDLGSSKIASLEGVRGLLAVIVLLSHSWLSFIKPMNGAEGTGPQQAVALAAELAVTCFFVLSGHVIALSLRSNHRRHAGFDLAGYATSRAFRILPPLLVTIAITWILAVVLDLVDAASVTQAAAERDSFKTTLQPQFLSLASLCTFGDLTGQLNGPLWSLEWEVRLYTLAGLAACITWRSGAWRIGAVLALTIYGSLLWLSDRFVVAAAAPIFIQFGFGAAAAWVGTHSAPRSALLTCVAAMGLITAFLALIPGSELFATDLGRGNVTVEMTVAMWFVLALLAARRVSGPRVLIALGSVSYTLYILHFPLLQALYFVLANHLPAAIRTPAVWWVWPLATVAVLGICIVVGQRFERPAAQRAWVARRMTGWLSRYRRGLSRPR